VATSPATLDHSIPHDTPVDNNIPAPAPSDQSHPKRMQVTIEDIPDEDDPATPSSAKEPLYFTETFKGASQTFGWGITKFECYKAAQDQLGLPPWAPYRNQQEWELAQWLVKNQVSQKGIDAYLKLKIVSQQHITKGVVLTHGIDLQAHKALVS
jgi:hypothetical protein